jgi:hypothetical protein
MLFVRYVDFGRWSACGAALPHIADYAHYDHGLEAVGRYGNGVANRILSGECALRQRLIHDRARWRAEVVRRLEFAAAIDGYAQSREDSGAGKRIDRLRAIDVNLLRRGSFIDPVRAVRMHWRRAECASRRRRLHREWTRFLQPGVCKPASLVARSYVP